MRRGTPKNPSLQEVSKLMPKELLSMSPISLNIHKIMRKNLKEKNNERD